MWLTQKTNLVSLYRDFKSHAGALHWPFMVSVLNCIQSSVPHETCKTTFFGESSHNRFPHTLVWHLLCSLTKGQQNPFKCSLKI